jgi:DNA-binding transcriptional MerR regulator
VNTEKSPEAFRTISEVSDWLGTPTHVLRFWESRFPQIKPVKRAGGRRYYRPADMELLGGIKRLLHEDGMTIRGVQKMLREQGVRRVADLSPPLIPDGTAPVTAADAPTVADSAPTALPPRAGPVLPPREMPGSALAPGDPGDHAQAADSGPEADMVEDAPADHDDTADIVPFVLDTRHRSDPARTPDLFDRLLPDDTAAPEPAPAPPAPSLAGRASGAARLPAIPPDPDDSAPLPANARRPLRGFRKPHGAPGDHVHLLYERLTALRGRLDRR